VSGRPVYFLSLFAGIGGFDLAAYWAGLRFDGHYFSEVDKYASAIFQKRFPEAVALRDIRSIEYDKLPKGEWIIAGGPPCQPFSVQGKRLKEKDSRNMWPEAVRSVRELRPCVAVYENVNGVLDYLDGCVLPAIESEGYKTETISIPASALGADHERKRWWVVAYADGIGQAWLQMFEGIRAEKRAETTAPQSLSVCGGAGRPGSFPRIPGEAHGVSSRMDRLKCLGNAIVPQCAEIIFRLPMFDFCRKEPAIHDR
jgi:DNA (cytosine-5)-methyltransferase 1